MSDLDDATALLEKRCAEIDTHYRLYPGPDLSMAKTAAAIRTVLTALAEMDAHLHSIRSIEGSCPQCADTKRDCANAIAEIVTDRLAVSPSGYDDGAAGGMNHD